MHQRRSPDFGADSGADSEPGRLTRAERKQQMDQELEAYWDDSLKDPCRAAQKEASSSLAEVMKGIKKPDRKTSDRGDRGKKVKRFQ